MSPNELSFASVGSWKDIYGYKSEGEGKKTHIKSDFYKIYGSGYKASCVGSEQNPRKHSAMKKTLSPAFSTPALLDQETIIDSCVDEFLKKIGDLPDAQGKGLDMTKWYEMATFDLFGEMAFGESFHAVETGIRVPGIPQV